MIAGLWHGTARAEHSDDYLAYLHKTGIPGYRVTQGNQGVQVLRRVEGDVAHFLLISYWESFEAIRRFAGEDMQKAVYYPRDRELLLEFEPNVLHCEVAADAWPRRGEDPPVGSSRGNGSSPRFAHPARSPYTPGRDALHRCRARARMVLGPSRGAGPRADPMPLKQEHHTMVDELSLPRRELARDLEARYINEEVGFSLVLPEGWSEAGPLPVAIDGGGSYNLYILGLEPSAEGGPGASRVFVADAASLTLEQFVLLQCSTCRSIRWSKRRLGSTPARITRIGGGSVPFEVEWFFIVHSGRLIGLSIIDPETMETIGTVLQSLRLE